MPIGKGWWISPEGKVYEVYEHLSFVTERPELFGISKEKAMWIGERDRDRVLGDVIRKGWIRVREIMARLDLSIWSLTEPKLADIKLFLMEQNFPDDQPVRVEELAHRSRIREPASWFFQDVGLAYARNPR